MEESMVIKTFIKAVGVGASILLTVFACLFAMASLGCLVMSVIQKDILSVILSAFCGFVAWMLWSVRKDVLI